MKIKILTDEPFDGVAFGYIFKNSVTEVLDSDFVDAKRILSKGFEIEEEFEEE